MTCLYVSKTRHSQELTILSNDEVTSSPLWDIAFTLPFHMKDSKNPNFTGRGDILDRLDIEAKSPSSKVIILHGLGGMGKTQTALEYVHSYYEGYSSVFWVDGTSEETANLGFRSVAQRLIDHHVSISTTPQPDYARIAQTLGLGSAVNQDGQLFYTEKGSTNKVLEAVKQWFSQKENQHWLLVLDNVDELTSFDINDFIPTASHGTVLITSRRKECIRLGKGLEIGEMLEPEAVLLLLKSAELVNPDSDTEHSQAHNIQLENPVLTGRHIDERIAKEIAKTLGYLPLAIDQAGSYVATRQMSLPRYKEVYKRNFRNIFTSVPRSPGWSYRDQTVFTTWEISFQEIEGNNKESAELLLLCSFLHNEDIWEKMLLRGQKLEMDGKRLISR